jgi:endogenous inhibitor of DNA gyrase (YacG/DUF329 family)
MSETKDKSGPKSGCPICGKAGVAAFAPFCSARCKQIDLNRWLSEVYVVPGTERPANSDDPDEDGVPG